MSSKKRDKKELYFPKGVNWKGVLNEIYLAAPGKYERNAVFSGKSHITNKLKISRNEFEQAVRFLKEHDLIEKETVEPEYLVLTKKGFDVALDNEKSLITLKSQGATYILTTLLTITAIINVLTGVKDVSLAYLYGTLFIVAIVVMFYVLRNLELR